MDQQILLLILEKLPQSTSSLRPLIPPTPKPWEVSDNLHKPTRHVRNNSGMGRVCSSQQLDHCRAPHASICNHISAWEEPTRGTTCSSRAEQDARTAPCPRATRRWEPTHPGSSKSPRALKATCQQATVPLHVTCAGTDTAGTSSHGHIPLLLLPRAERARLR